MVGIYGVLNITDISKSIRGRESMDQAFLHMRYAYPLFATPIRY
jgi:hypothetical protein